MNCDASWWHKPHFSWSVLPYHFLKSMLAWSVKVHTFMIYVQKWNLFFLFNLLSFLLEISVIKTDVLYLSRFKCALFITAARREEITFITIYEDIKGQKKKKELKILYYLKFSFPAYIHQLRTEPQEKAVQKLLAHFPLLKVGNDKAKTEYLALIPQILTYSNENGAYVEESRQLLSFSVIHPALTSEEHTHFNWWISHLNERFTSNFTSPQQQPSHIINHTGDHPEFTQCVPRHIGSARMNGGSFPYHRDHALEDTASQNNLMMSAENLPTLFKNQNTISSTHNHHGHPPLTTTLSAPATVNVIVSSAQLIHSHNNQGTVK